MTVWRVSAVFVALSVFCGGAQASGHGPVSDSSYGAYEVALAPWRDGLAVGWYDVRDGRAEIYLRLLDEYGRAKGPEYRLTQDDEESFEVDLAPLANALAVVWYGKDVDDELTARLALWHPERGEAWRIALSMGGGASRNPVVGAFEGRIFTAWVERHDDDSESLVAGWWDEHGRMLVAPQVLAPVSERTWNLNAVIDDSGVAWIVYDAAVDTIAEELHLVRFGERADGPIRLTADDGLPSKYPDLDLHDGRVAITWFDEFDGISDVFLFVGSVEDVVASAKLLDQNALRVTASGAESIGAYLAWLPGASLSGDEVTDSNVLGLAWSDAQAGAHDVYFQSFDETGSALGGIRRLSATDSHSLIPAIRPFRDGFAIAWNEVAPGPEGMHDSATRSEIHFVVVD